MVEGVGELAVGVVVVGVRVVVPPYCRLGRRRSRRLLTEPRDRLRFIAPWSSAHSAVVEGVLCHYLDPLPLLFRVCWIMGVLVHVFEERYHVDVRPWVLRQAAGVQAISDFVF